MNDPTKADPPNSRRGLFDEADIGSGEKSPGQHETEEMIREIPPLPQTDSNRQSGEGQQPQGEGDKGKGQQAPEPGNRQASGA